MLLDNDGFLHFVSSENSNRESRTDEVPSAAIQSGCAASGGSAPNLGDLFVCVFGKLHGYGFQIVRTNLSVI